jgi:F-type H+-transporting ATPase subunit gamma
VPQGLKDIRRRIRAVQSIGKITSAMKLVAASRLRRAQERASSARPYADALRDVLAAVGAEAGASQSDRLPLLARREVVRTGIVVVAGDRGRCGAYNTNVLRRMEQVRAQGKGDPLVIAMGRRARDYCERRRIPLLGAFAPIGDEPSDSEARAAAELAAEAFVDGRVDEVYLVTTQFEGAFLSHAAVERLLPVAEPERQEGAGRHPYEFEPDPETVLSRLLPAYLNSLVYRALLESKAAEQAARMMAMDNATRNAKDLVRNYTLTLNRLRQAAITGEIAELVAGAEAVQ